MLSNGCQHIVASHPYRLQQVGADASEGRVGGQQLYNGTSAKQKENQHECKESHAQNVLSFRVRVAVLLGLLAQPSEDVLHDA